MAPCFCIYVFFLSHDDKLQAGKHPSDMVPIKIGLKKRRRFITIAFQLCFRVGHKEGLCKPGWFKIKRYTSASGLS